MKSNTLTMTASSTRSGSRKPQLVLTLFAVFALGFSSFGQGSKVVSAYNYWQQGELGKAKENIDAAAKHEKTALKGKTWYYRGRIYTSIHFSDNDAYKSLSADPLLEAATSLKKAKELGTRTIDASEVDGHYKSLSDLCFQEGVNRYNEKIYPKAIEYFNTCRDIKKDQNIVDSLAIYNIGLAYENQNDYDNALKYYGECVDIGYGGAGTFSTIAYIYQKMEDDDKAFETLKKGREKYPSDQDLLTTEINLYLKYEKFDEAMENLNLTIQNDPDNSVLYYARGTIFNNRKDVQKAEADYLKAIELKPDYFDALYNLGALYFNSGADISNEAVELTDADEYEAAKKRADEMFGKALPQLEKAHSLDPENVSTMESLKQLYVRLGMNDKYKEMKEKLGN